VTIRRSVHALLTTHFATRGARAAFLAAAFAASVAGVSEGTLAAQSAAGRVPARADRAADAPTVVLVLRHAERAGEPGPDPALSEAGAARARQLVAATRATRVAAVYATQFRRTRETAEPLAQTAGVAVTQRPIHAANAARYAEDLAREIRTQHAGRTVAVIGHSNTVPALVAALAGGAPPALGEGEYGDVFVVILASAETPARVLRLRVGA
jgi:phosphohistidine phosphatase SixA